jgi:hypothetical protein
LCSLPCFRSELRLQLASLMMMLSMPRSESPFKCMNK